MFAHICAVFAHGRIAMIEAISCGGVVIFRGKILLLYKNYRNRYEGTEYDMMKPENVSRRPIGVTRSSDIHIIQTFTDLPKDTCQLQWLAMGNAEHSVFIPAFSGITDTHKGYKIDSAAYSASNMYWAFKRICGIAEQDREFLSEGVKNYWKAQEEAMYKSTMKDVKALKKAYKKSKKDGRAYATKIAKNYASKQLANSNKLYKELLFTSVDNVNDRADNARKTTFKMEG